MNFQSVAAWAAGIAIAAAAVGKLEELQRWIWTSEARTIEAARTSAWGSPRFFSQQQKALQKDVRTRRPAESER